MLLPLQNVSQKRYTNIHDTRRQICRYFYVSSCALRQEAIVEKLQHEFEETSMGTLCSSHTERWGGGCDQGVYECFTLCWLSSLGHRSSAWVLFTALPAHEVSLPGLESGQSSSVRLFLSPLLSQFGTLRLTVGPLKAYVVALTPVTLQSFTGSQRTNSALTASVWLYENFFLASRGVWSERLQSVTDFFGEVQWV